VIDLKLTEEEELWFRRKSWSLNKETLELLEKQREELDKWVEEEIARMEKERK
jgi:hypothetical protein